MKNCGLSEFAVAVRTAKYNAKPLEIWPGDEQRVLLASLPAYHKDLEILPWGSRTFVVKNTTELQRQVKVGKRYALGRRQGDLYTVIEFGQ